MNKRFLKKLFKILHIWKHLVCVVFFKLHSLKIASFILSGFLKSNVFILHFVISPTNSQICKIFPHLDILKNVPSLKLNRKCSLGWAYHKNLPSFICFRKMIPHLDYVELDMRRSIWISDAYDFSF